MNPLTHLARKFALLFTRNRFRSELEEEMAFHRDQVKSEMLSGGLSADAAQTAAARRFGNSTVLREKSHDVVAFPWESVAQDLRFALRQLRHHPAFAATAIFILALGIGISVAIFAFVDAALIAPLPYAAPNRLMDVAEKAEAFPRSNLSRDDYADWKRLNHSFSALEAYAGSGFLLRTPSGSVPVPAARVSDGFFSTLGVKPMLGRGFLPGEDQPGRAKIVVLAYGAWLKRFSGRNDIVGQALTLDGESYSIVGVLPRSFEFAPRASAEIFVPLLDKKGCEERRSCHNLFGIGRLRDGVSQQQALHEMQAIAAQLEIQYPDSNHGQGAVVQQLSEIIIGQARPILRTLLAASALLLLIAAMNVASLLLVRSESRRREIAVRGALGATAGRITRQFVTEIALLAASGWLAGLLLCVCIMSLLQKMIPKAMSDQMPFVHHVGLHPHVVLFAALVSGSAAALMVLTPLCRLSFQHIRDGLSDGGRSAAGQFWRRIGANLVVAELAVAVILLVAAGLLAKSFYRLLHVDIGFNPQHLATLQMAARADLYPKPEQRLALLREVARRLSALPGVQSVGFTSDVPVNCNCDTDWIRIVGKPFHGEHNEVNERDISPSYLPTLQARLVRGRFFTEDDDASKSQKILINQALASKYFPGEDPIGKKIANGALDPKSMREIIGVVANVREGALDEDLWPSEYQAMYYSPDNFVAVAIRTAGDDPTILPAAIRTIHQLDPNLGTYGEITMTDQINSSQSAVLHRFSAWLVGGFAGIALILSVVGLYGVIAYSVSQRTREIGVRMALGAQRSSVYSMVMRQAGWLTLAGIAIGLLCAVGASRLMDKLLFGVASWDMPTLAVVALVLGAASLAASFLPAHRAASVNPTEALRFD